MCAMLCRMPNVKKRAAHSHLARVPLTANERVRLETIATLERRTRGEILRQAFVEYAERVEREQAR
jgi:hypothetical protein